MTTEQGNAVFESASMPLTQPAMTERKLCPVHDLNIHRAEERLKSLPTTRYYGSKKRLLPWIYETLKDLPFHTVLDGFGGTASVSLLFKAMGKEVTFHDALLCNTIAAKALLADTLPFANPEEVQYFFDEIIPRHGFIAQTFSGKFYLDSENEWLDGAVAAIAAQPIGEKEALYYCLFQACLQKRPFNLFHRANLNLRTCKSVAQSFGNQTTWDTPFPVLAKRAYLELEKAIWRSPAKLHVLPSSDVSALSSSYDLVYLDPPYINPKNTGDDYLRRYHFLEGLSQYENWPSMIDHSYNNLQLKKNIHVTEWQSKRHFKDRLFNLVEKHSHSIVALSYVTEAFPSEHELNTLFKQQFCSVKIVKKELPHALSQGKKNELMIIGLP